MVSDGITAYCGREIFIRGQPTAGGSGYCEWQYRTTKLVWIAPLKSVNGYRRVDLFRLGEYNAKVSSVTNLRQQGSSGSSGEPRSHTAVGNYGLRCRRNSPPALSPKAQTSPALGQSSQARQNDAEMQRESPRIGRVASLKTKKVKKPRSREQMLKDLKKLRTKEWQPYRPTETGSVQSPNMFLNG